MDILIGKEGNQPFQIPDSLVSRRHACLHIDDYSKEMTLTDLNSVNGTFLYNGQAFVRLYPNTPCKVTYDSMIQLGPNTRFHVRKLFEKPKPLTSQPPKESEQKKEERVDIKELHLVSEHYQSRKMALDSKFGTINSLRSLTILVSLGSGVAGKFITPLFGVPESTSMVIGFIVAILLISTLLTFINTYSKKVKLEISDNEKQYAIRYVCPQCHTSFRGKYYQNILAEGCCPKCKIKYYDSRVKK